MTNLNGKISHDAAGLRRIVIVGGGAGGIELATRLGDTLGRRGKALVTLIDRSRTHLWKPLLHEFAAGTMDLDQHALDYLAQARWHHFRFQLGEMDGLDRGRRTVLVAPTRDGDGRELIPRREIAYDTLVIAVGSHSNDFGTPGALEHAISLDRADQAELFHRRLIDACIRANSQRTPLRPEQLNVAIIGAGATGVELAAELHKSTRELVAYGLDRIDPEKDVRLTIIEAAPRILPAMPERLSKAVTDLLHGLNVQVLTGERVTQVAADGVTTAAGKTIPAELTVWAAGIKAPDFLKDIGGLETNRINQLAVLETLQTTRDPDIFAMGDCASCPWPGHERAGPAHRAGRAPAGLPPRAHAAAPPRGQAVQAVALPRLRLAGLARRVLDRRLADGRAARRQPLRGGAIRAVHVRDALPHAPLRAARPGAGAPRYPRAVHHAADGAAGETALTRSFTQG